MIPEPAVPNLRAWKCDRCAEPDEWPENFWPKGWTIHHLGIENTGEVVLCRDCTKELADWWRDPEQIDGEAGA